MLSKAGLEWSSKGIEVQYREHSLDGRGALLQDTVYVLNQKPLYGAVSWIGRIHGFDNQEIEAGVTLLTITPSVPLRDFVLSVLTTLDTAGLEVLFPKRPHFCQGIWQRFHWITSCSCCQGTLLSVSRDQQVRRITIQQGQLTLISKRATFAQWGKEEHMWKATWSTWVLLVLWCSVVTMNRHKKKPWTEKDITNSSDPYRIKVGSHHQASHQDLPRWSLRWGDLIRESEGGRKMYKMWCWDQQHQRNLFH